MSESRVFRMGCDVGQKVDHSAVCLVEIVEGIAIVRALVKYPLGTGFTELAKTVAELYHDVAAKGDIYSLTVDATGLGTHPAGMIQQLLPEARVDFFIFTNKSKRELVGKVKVLHSFGKLKFAMRKGDDIYNNTIKELIAEMRAIQAKIIRADVENPEIEIFKTGAHDDLFTALALAVKDVQLDPNMQPAAQFVEDKSWMHTPLDEPSTGSPVIFF